MRQGLQRTASTATGDTGLYMERSKIRNGKKQQAGTGGWLGCPAFLSQCKCGFHSASTHLLLRPSLHDHPPSPFLNHLILVFVQQSLLSLLSLLVQFHVCKYRLGLGCIHTNLCYRVFHRLPRLSACSIYQSQVTGTSLSQPGDLLEQTSIEPKTSTDHMLWKAIWFRKWT